jgi:hypothetical protein
MLVQTNGGVKYFVVFIQNYLWYIVIYLLHNKSNVFDNFQMYKVMVETKIRSWKHFDLTNMGENLNQKRFLTFFRSMAYPSIWLTLIPP